MTNSPRSERREAFQRRLVAAVARDQETRDTTDRRHGDAREVVDLAVGQAILQVFDDGPPVDERFELCRRAEIGEELLALRFVAQAQDRAIEALLRASSSASRSVSICLHL